MNETVTIKASKALVEQLKPIAVANRRSVTQEINMALEEHIRAAREEPA